MGVDVKSDKLASLVDVNVEVKQLGTGFTFTEGPIWNPGGQFLLFSDMPGDTRRRWSEADGVQEVLSPSNKANGMTLDADGRLIVCEHSTSSLVRMDPDGKNTNREVLASHFEGQELNSPNDVCVKSDGSIWFSDPWYGRMPVFGLERERELGWQGVFRIPPGGGDPRARRRAGRVRAAERALLLAGRVAALHQRHAEGVDQGLRRRLGRHALERPDVLRGDRQRRDRGGHPGRDEVRRAGQRLGHGAGGVWVISADGEHLGTVGIPENVGNLTWGGPDWHTLFVPSSTSLYAFETKVGPRREPYMS